MTDTAESLDPLRLPLTGERLIEASAGTGKTFTIAALYLRLLLGLGLRSFSMHPSQVLAVKQEILRADTGKLQAWAQAVLDSDEPAELLVE